jgi:glycerol kinase
MPKQRFVLSIDQGTTGTHATLLDDRLRVRGKAYRELPQHFPRSGWVEHRLEEIWSTVEHCIQRALTSAGVKGRDVAAIGITNQRETTALWHRELTKRTVGRPVAPAIVWQDRRTAELCAQLKARGEEPRVKARTGLVLDPYFSGTKLTWLLENVREGRPLAESGALCFGTIDSYLVFRLTGGAAHVTEVSNASRTLLMDLETLDWHPDLLALFGVPPAVLPRIRGSAEVYGVTSGVGGLPDGIPIAGMAGDQQAALFGQGCLDPGDSKCTYGTGAFLLMNTGETPVRSQRGLLTTVGWQLQGKTCYALEGSAFIAGAAVQWLRDGLGILKRSRDVEKLAAKVKDSGEVVFVPALAGLGAPHWRPEARGLLAGLDRGTTQAHVARAVLEGIAFQVYELAEVMRDESGRSIPRFQVDGGASANNLLMQFQADLLGTPVVRPKNLETTGLGAALLAGLGAGVWDRPEVLFRKQTPSRTFPPRMAVADRARHLEKWNRAVGKA